MSDTKPTGPPVIAAFDIGSNSVKMTVARKHPDDVIEEFIWRAETTRLSQGIDATGRIADDRAEATMEALEIFALEALRAGAGRMVGVATEATRVAANGDELLARIREDTGIEIEAISGDQEAKLTFEGLDPRVNRNGNILIADIGGASAELIEASDGGVTSSRSLPFGSGRLTERFVVANPPSKDELASVRTYVEETVESLLSTRDIDRLIVVGGTAEYLRRLLDGEWPIEPAKLEGVLEVVQRESSESLAQIIEAAEARARVLPAGIAAVAGIADVVRPQEIVGAASGIRLGLIRAAFAGEI
jgi:exopolyphosphatase / guanosine-5'-triphosphate,3'-diphosphate pyrophosphatase